MPCANVHRVASVNASAANDFSVGEGWTVVSATARMIHATMRAVVPIPTDAPAAAVLASGMNRYELELTFFSMQRLTITSFRAP